MRVAYMMYIAGLTVLLLLPTIAVTRKTIVFSEDCPKDHYITKPDGSILKIELIQNDEKYCKKVERLKMKTQGGGYDPIKDLDQPRMTPVMVGNKYLARIELSLPSNKDKKYPRSVYLELTSYNISLQGENHIDEALDTKCIRLKITNSTADPYLDPLKFSFTCMEIVQDPASYLMFTMQMWSLPNRKSSPLCRQTRALGGQKSCGVRCSDPSTFPLTLDGENEYQLCACADKSRLNTTVYTREDKTVVKIEGLHPLIGNIIIRIWSKSGKFIQDLKTTGIIEGSTQFIVMQPLPPGNYSLMLDADCKFSRKTTSVAEIDLIKQRVGMQGCPEGDIHAVDFFKVEAILPQKPSMPLLTTLLIILTIIAVVMLITCLVWYFVYIHRRKHMPETPSSREQPINNTEITPLKPLPTDPEEGTSPLLQLKGNQPAPDSEFFQLCDHPTQPCDDITQSCDPPSKSCDDTTQSCDHPTQPWDDATQSFHQITMLLHHNYSVNQTRYLDNFIHSIEDKGIKMKWTDSHNWRDFAEGATDFYRNIVIILSQELNQLLQCYKKDGIKDRLFRTLIKERNQEYIPCIVMDKIRQCVQENLKEKVFTLHIVTLCDSEEMGEKLTKEFLEVHNFLERSNKYQIYNFAKVVSGNEDQFQSLVNCILAKRVT